MLEAMVARAMEPAGLVRRARFILWSEETGESGAWTSRRGSTCRRRRYRGYKDDLRGRALTGCWTVLRRPQRPAVPAETSSAIVSTLRRRPGRLF